MKGFAWLVFGLALLLAVLWFVFRNQPKESAVVPVPQTPLPPPPRMVPADEPPPTPPARDGAFRAGRFFVGGLSLVDAAAESNDSLATDTRDPDPDAPTRTYADNTDGKMARYNDHRLQRFRRVASQSNSAERFEMSRRLVARDIDNGATVWWNDGI